MGNHLSDGVTGGHYITGRGNLDLCYLMTSLVRERQHVKKLCIGATRPWSIGIS